MLLELDQDKIQQYLVKHNREVLVKTNKQQQQQQLTHAAPRKEETRIDMSMVKKDMPGETSMGKSEDETEIDQVTSSSKVKNVTTICDTCQQVSCLSVCSKQIIVHPLW